MPLEAWNYCSFTCKPLEAGFPNESLPCLMKLSLVSYENIADYVTKFYKIVNELSCFLLNLKVDKNFNILLF